MWIPATIAAGALLFFRTFPVAAKEGVDLSDLNAELDARIPLIDQVHRNLGITRGLLITAGRDGQHKTGSLHYQGAAIDVRTNDLKPEKKRALAVALRKALGADFDVVEEPTHIHIEYDPQ